MSEEIKTFTVRDISYEQAKKEIEDYLAINKHAWISQIAEDLLIDLKLIVDILAELKNEQKIKEHDE